MRYLKLYESYTQEFKQDLKKIRLDMEEKIQQKLDDISNDIKECMFDLTDDYDNFEYRVVDLTNQDVPHDLLDPEYRFNFSFEINKDRWEDFSEKLKIATSIVVERLGLNLFFGNTKAIYDNNMVHILNAPRNTDNIEKFIEHNNPLIKRLNDKYTKIIVNFSFDLV